MCHACDPDMGKFDPCPGEEPTPTEGQQHDQGDTFDPGLAEWERELIEQQQHDRGERRLIRSRWPKPVGNDTVDLAEARDAQGQHEPGDQGDVRARQIAAALTTMRAHEVEWCCHPASLAAELVDAVNAAGGSDADTERLRAELAIREQQLDDYRRLFDIQVVRMEAATARWQAAHQRARVMPDLAALLDWLMAQADQAEARGYAQAVANLRDVNRFLAWWRAQNLGGAIVNGMAADYLEAVGPDSAREVHNVERRPDGVIAEHHTIDRSRLAEADLPQRPVHVLIDTTRDGPSGPQDATDGPTHPDLPDERRTGDSGTQDGQGDHRG